MSEDGSARTLGEFRLQSGEEKEGRKKREARSTRTGDLPHTSGARVGDSVATDEPG